MNPLDPRMWDGFPMGLDDGSYNFQWSGSDDWLGPKPDGSRVQDVSEQLPKPIPRDSPVGEGHGSRSQPPGTCGPSEAEWDVHRPRIQELYLVEKKTLKEVMEIMARGGFRARDDILLFEYTLTNLRVALICTRNESLNGASIESSRNLKSLQSSAKERSDLPWARLPHFMSVGSLSTWPTLNAIYVVLVYQPKTQ